MPRKTKTPHRPLPDVYFHSRPDCVVMQLPSPQARWSLPKFPVDCNGQTTFCGNALEPGGALDDAFTWIDTAGMRLLML